MPGTDYTSWCLRRLLATNNVLFNLFLYWTPCLILSSPHYFHLPVFISFSNISSYSQTFPYSIKIQAMKSSESWPVGNNSLSTHSSALSCPQWVKLIVLTYLQNSSAQYVHNFTVCCVFIWDMWISEIKIHLFSLKLLQLHLINTLT